MPDLFRQLHHERHRVTNGVYVSTLEDAQSRAVSAFDTNSVT